MRNYDIYRSPYSRDVASHNNKTVSERFINYEVTPEKKYQKEEKETTSITPKHREERKVLQDNRTGEGTRKVNFDSVG